MKIRRWLLALLALALGLSASAGAQVMIDEANFPDPNLRNYIQANFDMDESGSLSDEELGYVTRINVPGEGIRDMTGIARFPNLSLLNCADNQLTALDLTGCASLAELQCGYNQLTALDVSACPALTLLDCAGNRLTSLDLAHNGALETLACEENACAIKLAADHTFDLGQLPGGFRADRASAWTGGSVEGNLLTVAPGAARVTYAYDLGGGFRATFALLTGGASTDIPVTGLEIVTPGGETVFPLDEAISLSVAFTPEGAAAPVTWKCKGKAARLEASESSATLTPLKPGKATVTAKAGGKSAKVKLVIYDPAVVSSLLLDPAGSVLLEVGEEMRITPIISPASAAAVNPVTWSSRKPQVASVDESSGVVTALAPGKTVIVAKAGKKSARLTLRVIAPAGE